MPSQWFRARGAHEAEGWGDWGGTGEGLGRGWGGTGEGLAGLKGDGRGSYQCTNVEVQRAYGFFFVLEN